MTTITALRKCTTMLVLIVSVLTISCIKYPPEEPEVPSEEPVASTITMATTASKVDFYMQMKPGTGSIVTDWGDGEESKTYVISDDHDPNYLNVEHDYSGASEPYHNYYRRQYYKFKLPW